MNYKQHVIYGSIISLVFVAFMYWKFDWYQITPVVVAQAIMIIGISTLVPDLDHENGKLHQLFLGMGLIIGLLGVFGYLINELGGINLITGWASLAVAGIVLAATTFFTAQFASHRGFFHSVSFCFLYGSGLYLLTGLQVQMGVLAMIACYTHLVLDGEAFKIR